MIFGLLIKKKDELTQSEKFGLCVLFEEEKLKMKIDDEEIIFKIEIKNFTCQLNVLKSNLLEAKSNIIV